MCFEGAGGIFHSFSRNGVCTKVANLMGSSLELEAKYLFAGGFAHESSQVVGYGHRFGTQKIHQKRIKWDLR